ncbi:hypothetical protein H0H93_012857, partial [Arthromyces matolae]
AELALIEAGLQYTRFEIDVRDKPDWYPAVNPAGKVPALTYGGPIVDPTSPSNESAKLAESLVIIEFIADISGKLLPSDPVQRAKARFFISTVTDTIVSTFPLVAVPGPASLTKILDSIEKIQSILPAEGFAIGDEFTIADIAVAPFFARLELVLEGDLGAFEEGAGPKTLEILNNDDKFVRYRKYFADIKARESFRTTFDRETLWARMDEKLAPLRGQRKSQIA